MKNAHKINIALIAILVLFLLVGSVILTNQQDKNIEYFVEAINPRAIPTWIQYDERVVGENHPTYTDVANRVTKVIWNTFTSEHTTDGEHKYVPTFHTQYAVTGTGTGDIASAVFPDAGFDVYSSVTLFAVINPDELDEAGSIYAIYDNEYSESVWNFKKTAANQLAFDIMTSTVTSSGTVFDSLNLGQPIEVGVILDWDGPDITFFYDGQVEASQSAAFIGFQNTTSETHKVGDGFDGDILMLSGSRALMYTASSEHTPLYEGLSQCINCFLHYNMNEGVGSILNDINGEQKGTTQYDLTINGTWTQYLEGY